MDMFKGAKLSVNGVHIGTVDHSSVEMSAMISRIKEGNLALGPMSIIVGAAEAYVAKKCDCCQDRNASIGSDYCVVCLLDSGKE